MRVHVTFELGRPGWLRTSHRRFAILLAVVLMLGLPMGVFASDRFADVPTTSIFHANINAIAGAGITLGCGTPNYCPSANVNREQMAAFLHRGFARTGNGSFNVVPVDGDGTTNNDASVLTIKAGEATGGTVFVKVDGQITTYATSVVGCPCQAQYLITHDGDAFASFSSFNQLDALNETSGLAMDTGYVSHVFEVPSGTTQTFRLQVFLYAGAVHSAQGHLTAVYAPFGRLGTTEP